MNLGRILVLDIIASRIATVKVYIAAVVFSVCFCSVLPVGMEEQN